MALPAQLDELNPAWREIRARLRRLVGESTYEIWLAPLEVKAWDGAVLLLQAPSSTEAWVAKRFGRVLESCVRGVIGERIEVAFAGRQVTESGAELASAGTPASLLAPASRGVALNPRFSFDQFVIGDGNRLAHAASLAVAEFPGQAYNPLFLHAPPGLGKTHLLHAIGNYILAFGGGASVMYTTVEAFTNHFINSLSSRSVDRFKRAYRGVDVLLIDDVQFLASKAKTGEELFHTFNALHETGRQLVLTCDRLPGQLLSVEERLRERFQSGLVAEIEPPEYGTRLAILRKRAALDSVPVDREDVLELLADRITDNVRALEGALIRIVAHHSLTGEPITVASAERVLDGIAPRRAKEPLSTERIQAAVSSYFNVPSQELLSATRTAHVAWARQVAIHLVRELTGSSLHDIGAAFGGRNHATVVHACRRVAERVRDDPESAQDVDRLRSIIHRAVADRKR